MAVTSKDLRPRQTLSQGSAGERLRGKQLPRLRLPRLSGSLVATLLTALLVVLMFGIVGGWAQTALDDWRYGRPRTYKLTAMVGHEAGKGLPTQFVAMNLNRRVVIFEFPGGEATEARTIVGPYLFGQGEDLTPVTLELQDLTGDELPELLVNVKNEVLVYINEPGGFRTMTPEEHQQIVEQP